MTDPAIFPGEVRLLAVETSGRSGSVAALVGEQVVAEIVLPATPRTAATLAPAVQRLLHELDWPIETVGLVATTSGPGSFTGLRIGVTTAKMLAYLAGCEVVGVDTLDALAAGIEAGDGTVHCVLDAGRGELFAATYRRRGESWVRQSRELLISLDAWSAALAPGDVVAGPVLGKLTDRLPPGVVVAPAEPSSPRAGVVGRLALAAARRGDAVSPFALTPFYGRPSAAEEKRGSQ